MKRAATGKKVTTTDGVDMERLGAMTNAKQYFIGASIDMGWRLALVVLIPIFIGVRLDNYYDTAPSYTLTALVIALVWACYVVWKTIKDLDNNTKISKRKKAK